MTAYPTPYDDPTPWGICPRCGRQVKLSEIVTEWSGSRVCRKHCHDPRPPDTRPPRIRPEGVPVRGAAPEPPPIFRDPSDPPPVGVPGEGWGI